MTDRPSSHDLISTDCYMVVANDCDNSTMLGLDSFTLDDVIMTDDQEIIDDRLLI